MISRGVIDIWVLATITLLLSGGGNSEASFTFSVATSESYNANCFAETVKRGLFNGGALANCCHRCLLLGSACSAVSYSALNRSCNFLSAVNQTSAANYASGQCTMVKSEVTIVSSIVQSTIRTPTAMQSTMVAAAAVAVSSRSTSGYFPSNPANGSSISTTTLHFYSAFGVSSSLNITTSAVPNAATEEQTTTAQEEPHTATPKVIDILQTSLNSMPGISSDDKEQTLLVPSSRTTFAPLLSTKLSPTVAELSAATSVSGNSETMAANLVEVVKAVGDTFSTNTTMVAAANVTTAVPGYNAANFKGYSSIVSTSVSFSLNDTTTTKTSVLSTTTDVASNIGENIHMSTGSSSTLFLAGVEATYSTTSNSSNVELDLPKSKALAVVTNATLMTTLATATTLSTTTKSATSTGLASTTITAATTRATTTKAPTTREDQNSQD